jgi:hypothetical protein
VASDTPTARTWPCSLREAALLRALEQLGQAETARNQGPIVEWSLAGLTSRAPDSTGWARWCAFFVSQCYRAELLARGDEALLQHWRRIASGDCDTLWQRLSAEGWTWARIGGAPPARGDLLFLGDGADLRHVGLVEEYADRRVRTVEGNAGRLTDRVARGRYSLADSRIWGFARVPW